MKKVNYFLSIVATLAAFAFISCNGSSKELPCPNESTPYVVETSETAVPADTVNGIPEYTILNKTQADLNAFPKDAEGAIVLFCGKSLYGWRGYNRDSIPGRWIIDETEGAIKFNGSGTGEGQEGDGGDLIFAYKFKNFELSIDWKVSKGANSGIFYLAQEIKDQPIYISSPESQVLDNENHPDAKLGVDGNRKSSSLYDMIAAKPQNAKPFGEWNTTKIMVYKGTVVHYQNGANVLEYHLWTPQWTELLQASKFSKEKWPLAFELLNNVGGPDHEGYIGLQDHGDDIWFKNIKIKILE
jgi:hypothetical protein